MEQPRATVQGLVTVQVPAGTATGGNGVVVALPPETVAGNTSQVQLTMADGRPLPTWLRYDTQSNALVLAAVPDGAFPLALVLRVGNQRTVLQISEDSVRP